MDQGPKGCGFQSSLFTWWRSNPGQASITLGPEVLRAGAAPAQCIQRPRGPAGQALPALPLRKTLERPAAEWRVGGGVVLRKSQAAGAVPTLSYLCSGLTGLGCRNLNLTGGSNLLFHAEMLKKGDGESKTGNCVLLCRAVGCRHLGHCTWLEACTSRQTEQEEACRTSAARQPFPWNRVVGCCSTLVPQNFEGRCRTDGRVRFHIAPDFLSPRVHLLQSFG